MAVAHSILIVIYHVLKDGTLYHEFGAEFFDPRQRETVVRHSVRRLEKLGFAVVLTPTAA